MSWPKSHKGAFTSLPQAVEHLGSTNDVHFPVFVILKSISALTPALIRAHTRSLPITPAHTSSLPLTTVLTSVLSLSHPLTLSHSRSLPLTPAHSCSLPFTHPRTDAQISVGEWQKPISVMTYSPSHIWHTTICQNKTWLSTWRLWEEVRVVRSKCDHVQLAVSAPEMKY